MQMASAGTGVLASKKDMGQFSFPFVQHLSCAYAGSQGGGGTLHRAPVGQGPPGPVWLAISLGFWSVWTGACYWHGV